jgi:hypothetical protein
LNEIDIEFFDEMHLVRTFKLSFESHVNEEISKSEAAKAKCPKKNKQKTLKIIFILKKIN